MIMILRCFDLCYREGLGALAKLKQHKVGFLSVLETLFGVDVATACKTGAYKVTTIGEVDFTKKSFRTLYLKYYNLARKECDWKQTDDIMKKCELTFCMNKLAKVTLKDKPRLSLNISSEESSSEDEADLDKPESPKAAQVDLVDQEQEDDQKVEDEGDSAEDSLKEEDADEDEDQDDFNGYSEEAVSPVQDTSAVKILKPKSTLKPALPPNKPTSKPTDVEIDLTDSKPTLTSKRTERPEPAKNDEDIDVLQSQYKKQASKQDRPENIFKIDQETTPVTKSTPKATPKSTPKSAHDMLSPKAKSTSTPSRQVVEGTALRQLPFGSAGSLDTKAASALVEQLQICNNQEQAIFETRSALYGQLAHLLSQWSH